MTLPAFADTTSEKISEPTTTEWTVREKFAAIQAMRWMSRPHPDNLAIVAGMWRAFSQFVTLLAVACVAAGPFTCFVSWIWTYYISLAGLPVHLLALTFGIAAERRNRTGVGSSAGGSFGIIWGGVGIVLATLVLALAHGYW